MTTATVRAVIERFLESDTPEVLALKGAWGVGKTYTWKRLVKELKDKVKLRRYCYASLFGVSSLAELQLAIVANVRPVKQLGQPITAKSVNEDWLSYGQTAGRKILQIASSTREILSGIPYARNVSVALEALAAHFISDTLICLDDFERLGSRLPADELLGFVSSLKEEKGCKIVLVFNEEKLAANADVYKKYREKLVDLELLFAPTVEEAADLVLAQKAPWQPLLRERVIKLGIKNIRLLRKVDRLASIICEPIKGLHPNVLKQAADSLVLVSWIYYEPDEAKPSIEFLKKFNTFQSAFNRVARERDRAQEPETDEERKAKAWEQLLDDYGFGHMDEFDLAVIKVVEQGYLEETGLVEQAKKVDAQFRAADLEQSFSNAWRMFHDSFTASQDDLVGALRESFKRSVKQIDPLNANGTVKLLRALGQDAIADELIAYYVEERGDEAELFDLQNYAFSGDITDAELRAKFMEQHARIVQVPSLLEAASKIAEGGWSEAETAAMQRASEEDFYNLFKGDHGEKLHALVKACASFGRGQDHEEVGRRVKAALDRIAGESPLNAIRVKRHLGGG